MDKAAASQYLHTLFSDGKGYVAVAYKDKGSSWQECQFAWPQDKNKILGWAEVHHDANIFICPALRGDAHTRKKGDGVNLQWLWADIDWQTVPADKKAEVQKRINELGSLVVASGSGDNAHVYVKLSGVVDAEHHAKLNTGLRDYLYGDNKQADNSLLRLPGTTNWKTEAGTPVSVRGGHNKAIAAGTLMRRRAFRDAKVIVDAEATEWSYVEVEGLPRRLQRKITMSVEEARGIYKKRHAAVWAITKDLIRYNLDPDEIHSLMDKFPPAIDKMSEENGYDVHRDVDKCLAAHRVVEHIDPDLSPEEHDELTDAIQELTEDEALALDEEEIERWAEQEYKRIKARKRAKALEAERGWVEPPDNVSWSLTDAMNNPPKPVPHLITGWESSEGTKHKGLAGKKHNVVITAQYKVGKTVFVMGTIASALCDEEDFLNQFPVNVPPGGAVVGHWNCEMDPDEMLDDYIRPVGIKNEHNLHVANLRGYRVNILTDVGKKWAVEWLRARNVQVWTIDSFARLARMAGVSEKDNDEVMSLLMALDEIKVEAGVDALFLITHTGRVEQEEGKERARGATALDDWADARWIMTKVDEVRFLRVEGRGVKLDDSALIFDKETTRYSLGFGGKTEVREDAARDHVVKIVNEHPGINKSALLAALKSVGISNRAANEPIEEAIVGDFIEVRVVKRRGRDEKEHYPSGSLQGRSRHMKATPRSVDLRGAEAKRTANKGGIRRRTGTRT